jgi:hypothetical protein
MKQVQEITMLPGRMVNMLKVIKLKLLEEVHMLKVLVH